jgi:hypothetical protein
VEYDEPVKGACNPDAEGTELEVEISIIRGLSVDYCNDVRSSNFLYSIGMDASFLALVNEKRSQRDFSLFMLGRMISRSEGTYLLSPSVFRMW